MFAALGHFEAELSDTERENIKRSWKLNVAPYANEAIAQLRQQWVTNPSDYPKQKTYLVVWYKMEFSHEWNLVIGDTFLFEGMQYVNSYTSSTKHEGKLFPNEYGLQPNGIYFVSFVVADPEQEAATAQHEYDGLSSGAKTAADGTPLRTAADGSHFESEKARLDFIYQYLMYCKRNGLTEQYREAYDAYGMELFYSNDPDYSPTELFVF